jgi:hypothetical protein
MNSPHKNNQIIFINFKGLFLICKNKKKKIKDIAVETSIEKLCVKFIPDIIFLIYKHFNHHIVVKLKK